jgi:hypothetical protein
MGPGEGAAEVGEGEAERRGFEGRKEEMGRMRVRSDGDGVGVMK